jgi:hypothetical protein
MSWGSKEETVKVAGETHEGRPGGSNSGVKSSLRDEGLPNLWLVYCEMG